MPLFLFGALGTFAHAPFFILPLFVISFGAWSWRLMRASSYGEYVRLTFWFALGYFMSGTYWIAHALLVEAEDFAIFIPLAVFALSAAMALFHTAMVSVVFYVPTSKPLLRIFALSSAWLAAELLRGNVPWGGFPWHLAGYIWAIHPLFMQAASVVGIWGMSFLTLLLSLLCAHAVLEPTHRKRFGILAGALFVSVMSFNSLRFVSAPKDYVPNVTFRIVQPNIPQRLKWQPEMRVRAVEKMMEMSRAPGIEAITHLVWSEAAIPFVLHPHAPLLSILKTIIPPHGLLITGGMRAEENYETQENPPIWNSAFVIDAEGTIQAQYDKRVLVPFGEFVPLRALIPFEKITYGLGDFARGEGSPFLELKQVGSVRPLICYEAIFPDHMFTGDPSHARPQLLLNLTNDNWFGLSIGPYQHFAMAQFRAIEQGAPLLRAAGGGISAMIDSYGRIDTQLGLHEEGILDVPLPKVSEKETWYSRGRNNQ